MTKSVLPKDFGKPTMAPSTHRAQTAREMEIPEDVGLVPGMFIYPRGRNRPSWFEERGRPRMAIEWEWLKSKFTNMTTQIHYKFFLNRAVRPRPRLDLPFRAGRLTSLAANLHRDMYAAFADGDVPTLRTICADGLLLSMRSRIAERSPNERLTWTCEQVVRQPRVVASRVMGLPAQATGGKLVGFRQVVVRICTRQNLTTLEAKGSERPGYKLPGAFYRGQMKTAAANRTPEDGMGEEWAGSESRAESPEVLKEEIRDMTEYLVLQRRYIDGKEEPWMVWGLAEETDYPRLLRLKEEMEAITRSQAAARA